MSLAQKEKVAYCCALARAGVVGGELPKENVRHMLGARLCMLPHNTPGGTPGCESLSGNLLIHPGYVPLTRLPTAYKMAAKARERLENPSFQVLHLKVLYNSGLSKSSKVWFRGGFYRLDIADLRAGHPSETNRAGHIVSIQEKRAQFMNNIACLNLLRECKYVRPFHYYYGGCQEAVFFSPYDGAFQPLSQVIKDRCGGFWPGPGPFANSEVRSVMEAVLSGLHYMTGTFAFYHTDLSTDNIMIKVQQPGMHDGMHGSGVVVEVEIGNFSLTSSYCVQPQVMRYTRDCFKTPSLYSPELISVGHCTDDVYISWGCALLVAFMSLGEQPFPRHTFARTGILMDTLHMCRRHNQLHMFVKE
jgi:serine/threonine protein kinase